MFVGSRVGDSGTVAPPLSRDRVAAVVATELLRVAPDAIDDAVKNALGEVARHVAADRGYYYRLDDAEGAFVLAHEWHAPVLRPMRERARFARLPVTILPEPFLETLRRGQVIALPRTRGLLASPVEDIVAPDGDRALAIVPTLLDGALIGVAGFAATREDPWAADDVELAALVAQGVARAVERGRAHAASVAARAEAEEARADAERARAEAEEARSEMVAFVSRIGDAFIALDREGRYRYVNDTAVAVIGQPREALIGREPWVADRRLEGGRVQAAFQRAVSEQRAVTFDVAHTDGRRHYAIRVYPSPTGASVFAEDITERKRREEELSSEREYLLTEAGELEAAPRLVGFGDGLAEVMARVDLVAAGTTNVLITGETGTGKELVARAIHERSPRRARLLVKVNCAAISAGLVESELFGHEKGAFTGALARRKGRFELAHGGTLLLDEVGELPLDLQAKLLRVLQEREFERVGGSETVRVDVRVLAATNRDLAAMVTKGTFREDLYYRLAVFPVALPPLRARAGDIAILAHAFLRRFARQAGKRIEGFAPEALRRLESYRWPGNVRELQNVVERAVILETGSLVGAEALPELDHVSAGADAALGASLGASAPVGESHRGFVRMPRTIDTVERDYVARTLAQTDWIIEGDRGAARRLGLHPNTLRSRLKRWGLKRPSNDVPGVVAG
jgi:PAS domain S-box-containing protein